MCTSKGTVGFKLVRASYTADRQVLNRVDMEQNVSKWVEAIFSAIIAVRAAILHAAFYVRYSCICAVTCMCEFQGDVDASKQLLAEHPELMQANDEVIIYPFRFSSAYIKRSENMGLVRIYFACNQYFYLTKIL